MADRNPWIPNERRSDMEEKAQTSTDTARQRYAELQAELVRQMNAGADEDDEALHAGDSSEPSGDWKHPAGQKLLSGDWKH